MYITLSWFDMLIASLTRDYSITEGVLCKARQITYAWQPMHRDLADEPLRKKPLPRFAQRMSGLRILRVY